MSLLSMARITVMLLILLGCQKQEPEETKPIPPNIIYILADDLGYGDISGLNEASAIQTPHIDRLIKEGMYFTDAHSASSVCTPTRYGILTGRYAWRSPLKSGVLWGYSPPLIEKKRPTVALFLQEHGYHTAVVGKWHLGLGWQKINQDSPVILYDYKFLFDSTRGSNVDFSRAVSGGPSSLGFDYSFVFPSSLDMTPYLFLENDQAVTEPTAFTAGKSEAVDGRGVFWRAGEIAPDMEIENVLGELTDKALNYIQTRGAEGTPFFLYFPLTAPHAPWVPLTSYHQTSEAGRYGDFVKQVDATVGQILTALDELDLTENTLVLLSSDNGAHWTPLDKEQFAHRSNYRYRGQKADIYEGGHRIPYIVRWPQAVPAGTVSPYLISTTDFFATIAGVLGEEPPAGAAEDSYNMVDAYMQQAYEPIRQVMIQHSLNGHFAIREGDWKYTPQLGSGGFTQPSYSEPLAGEAPGTLYHLEKDPGETDNLYASEPARVDRLHKLLETMTVQNP